MTECQEREAPAPVPSDDESKTFVKDAPGFGALARSLTKKGKKYNRSWGT